MDSTKTDTTNLAPGSAVQDGRTHSSAGDLKYLIFILAVGLLSYLPWLGSYGLLDPTDSFFLESGRESLETNQYLLPLNNYVPWLDKPILFFWLVEAAFKLFGTTPFVGRLPAALSAVACGLLIYAGSRPLLSKRTATLASLIFMSAPLASIIGHVCLTDMTLCALISGSLLFLYKGLEFSCRKNLYLGYVFLGLAMLCKGPIAIILSGLAFLPFLISLSFDWKSFWTKVLALRPLEGALIVLLMNVPWYWAASVATSGRFLVDFFWTQNFGRMVGTVNHQGPFYFYIPVFFGGFFPWCLFSLSAPGIFKKTYLQKKEEKSPLRRFLRFALFWFATVIVLFSAIKTKLPTYILPCLPAFSILVAVQLEVLARSKKLQRLLPGSVLLCLAFCIGLGIQGILKGYVREIFSSSIWIIAPVILALAVNCFALKRKNAKVYAMSLLACALLISAIMVPRGLQIFYQARQVGFSKLVCRARDERASVAMVFAEEPSVPWITHQPVSRLQDKTDALRFLKDKPAPHYVLVQTALLDRMDLWFKVEKKEIAAEGKWHLYSVP